MDMNAAFITVMEALEPIIVILELYCVCLPDPTVFIYIYFFPSVLIGAISIILKQPNMLASHINKRGTGELPLFELINYRQSFLATVPSPERISVFFSS